MERVKWITQHLTGLIVWPVTLVLLPYVLGQIGRIVGIWSLIDTAYPVNPTVFWLSMIVSRVAYSWLWYGLTDQFIERGKKSGVFWFAPEASGYGRRDPVSVDKSGEIAAYVIFAVFAFVIGEFVIRLATWTVPPYLPPHG